jgi:septal ring factor EnvC (AmiA/AmiB activator)
MEGSNFSRQRSILQAVPSGSSRTDCAAFNYFAGEGNRMPRFAVLVVIVLALSLPAAAQDIQGLENCTAEKSIDRRVGCMQSNIAYLHQVVTKRSADFQQKLDASNKDIADLKSTVASLRARLDEIQAAKQKEAEPKAK